MIIWNDFDVVQYILLGLSAVWAMQGYLMACWTAWLAAILMFGCSYYSDKKMGFTE